MTAAVLLDLLLLMVLLGYAVSGAVRGLVLGALSLAGFLAGGVAGIALVPLLVESLDDAGGRPLVPAGLVRVAVVVGGILLLALLGQVLGGLVGARLRRHVTAAPARVLDGALGAVAALSVVALLTWFVAGAVRAGPSPVLSRAVGDSRVVRAVDSAVPAGAAGITQPLRDLLRDGAFPRVFAGIGPEAILPVDPPEPSDVSGVAAEVAGSVVKVTGEAQACGRGQEGTGFVTSPERVVTNAHVVAGMDEPSVRVTGEGPSYPARVVVFDPEKDLAVLAVPGLTAPALPMGSDLGRSDAAVVAGFPLSGPYTSAPARVRQVLTARGENIYGEPGVDRQVYSLFTRVEPGNSGGPLLDDAGRVVGVVFAKSLDDPETGYALTLAESRPVLEAAARATSPVDVGPCAASR